MGQETLLAPQLDGAKALVVELRNRGFDVTVAGWSKMLDRGDWRLHIASKDVTESNISDAYVRVIEAVNALPDEMIDLSDIRLIPARDPIATALLAIRATGRGKALIRSGQIDIGGSEYVTDTLVYPAV